MRQEASILNVLYTIVTNELENNSHFNADDILRKLAFARTGAYVDVRNTANSLAEAIDFLNNVTTELKIVERTLYTEYKDKLQQERAKSCLPKACK